MANSDASQCQFLETGVWVWTHRRYITDNIQAVWRGSQDSQEFVKAFCIVPGCLKLQLFRKTCHQFLARSVDSIIVSKTYKPNSGNNKNQTKSNANRPTGLSYSSFHPFSTSEERSHWIASCCSPAWKQKTFENLLPDLPPKSTAHHDPTPGLQKYRGEVLQDAHSSLSHFRTHQNRDKMRQNSEDLGNFSRSTQWFWRFCGSYWCI